jgi:hypothetical protein
MGKCPTCSKCTDAGTKQEKLTKETWMGHCQCRQNAEKKEYDKMIENIRIGF